MLLFRRSFEHTRPRVIFIAFESSVTHTAQGKIMLLRHSLTNTIHCFDVYFLNMIS